MRNSGASVSSPRKRGGGRWRVGAEEEDARRRRALAEMVDMDGCEGCRWETSVFLGTRKNALFCRSWVPVSGEMK